MTGVKLEFGRTVLSTIFTGREKLCNRYFQAQTVKTEFIPLCFDIPSLLKELTHKDEKIIILSPFLSSLTSHNKQPLTSLTPGVH